MASRSRRNWLDPDAERAWTRSYALQMAQQSQSANAPVHDQQQLTSPDGIHPAPSPLNKIPDHQTRPVVILQAFPSPADYGLGSVMSSPAGSGAESRSQTHFQHF